MIQKVWHPIQAKTGSAIPPPRRVKPLHWPQAPEPAPEGMCMPERHLLIVAHAPSENTRLLRDAAVRGASADTIENVQVRCVAPLEATPEDVLQADGILLGTTENLGYMSGALKDFFDRCYYPVLRRSRACPAPSISGPGMTGQAPAGRWRP